MRSENGDKALDETLQEEENKVVRLSQKGDRMSKFGLRPIYYPTKKLWDCLGPVKDQLWLSTHYLSDSIFLWTNILGKPVELLLKE